MLELPPIFRVRQSFDAPTVEDIEGEVERQLASLKLGNVIKPGQTVAITAGSRGIANIARITKAAVDHFKSLGAKPFTATVYHVGNVADPGTRQVEVLAWVKNPGELKPGFFAEVTLSSETRAGAVVVPEAAVQASEKGFVVYAVQGDKARARPVQVGLRTGTGLVEIVSGLKAGETVVVEGSDRLADGTTVQAAPPAGGPAAGGSAGGRSTP